MIKLPARYSKLSPGERRAVRIQYELQQNGLCWLCNQSLEWKPSNEILALEIDWSLFPPNFLKHPIHLQHNHNTDLTEGAVHSYCNAVLWQYYGR